MTDFGIRPNVDAPIDTHVKTTSARRLDRKCAHGRVAWVIGSQRWHRKSDVAGEEHVLELCEAKS